MSKKPERAPGFAHVEAGVFDLDNTLYPADCNLFAQIDRRMGEFIANSLGIPLEEAKTLRETYYYRHGTTLAGLVRLHGVAPDARDDAVIDLARQEAQRQPDHAAPVRQHALDGKPGLAGIGRAENGLERGSVCERHCAQARCIGRQKEGVPG